MALIRNDILLNLNVFNLNFDSFCEEITFGVLPAWKYWQDGEQKPHRFDFSLEVTVSHHPCLFSHFSRLKQSNVVSPSLILIIAASLNASFLLSGTSFSAFSRNFSHSDSGGRSGGYFSFSHAYFPFESIRFWRN